MKYVKKKACIVIWLQMALYNIFSYNAKIQYKSYLFTKATLFTLLTGVLTVLLPFFVAYKSRGFWLISAYFYEQPLVHLTYDYLLIAETDDPSVQIICGETASLYTETEILEENCIGIQIQEESNSKDEKNDILKFESHLIVPKDRTISSLILILGIDFKIQTTCPLQMQSLLIVTKDFSGHPNLFKYYGDLQIYQIEHLPCLQNTLDTTYNSSLFKYESHGNKNRVDLILDEYICREVITTVKPIYSSSQNGHTGYFDLSVNLRVPQMKFEYTPSLMQEFKWAWPQYLSLLLIFYIIFERIRKFVFSNRLLMVWEIVPWKKKD